MELEKYVQSFEDYFWEFDSRLSSDNGSEVISIPNTFTIAYEEFIFEILEFLSDDGFPPFGSLLLAIIGTNQENEGSIYVISLKAEEKIKLNKASYANPEGEFFRVGAVIDFLKILSSLPEEYKRGEKRLELFQTIFHDCHKRVSSEKAKKILDEYREKKKNGIKFQDKQPFNLGNFIKDFRTIALLKAKFPTVQSILDAMANLPQQDLNDKLEDEILEEKKLSENVTDFVDQLIEDDRTFQVGSLIKRLWSGLNIPLHHNHPSQQPLGGISDLTNKGDFDKLVISEFAHDDDVFMSRIANNEALYIQREVPPEADKFQRILLIDVSLKNWGNPKILSFASAIAIARHPKTDIECKVFAVGDSFKEISLDNINEIIYSLGELNGKLECSKGLDAFFKENKIESKNQEVFLFSSEESLKLAPMQKALSDYFSEIKYVFEMELESIKIFKNHNKGRKMLQHIIMPLDELWVRDHTKKYAVKDLSENTIPLFYPVERTYQNIFSYENESFVYMNNSLFKFGDEKFEKGFVKIASNLPFKNGNFAMKVNSEGERILLYNYFNFRQYVSTINLNTYELKNSGDFASEINAGNVKVFEHENEFYFTDNINFWLIDDDFKANKLDGVDIKKVYDNYFQKRSVFVNLFKSSKIKYNIIKKLDAAVIEEGNLKINDYYISNLLFQKYRNFMRKPSEVFFEERVNLILKNKGTSAVNLFKTLKQFTDKSPLEIKEIIDYDFSVILSNVNRDEAEKLKKEIEKNGDVCYIETQYLITADGSKITNQNGILIFESSNKQIETFYIPFVINIPTAMASKTEFTGNNYFISKEYQQMSMDTEVFREKYLNSFIQNILNHGA
ncbi:hypothetical protein HNP37_001997 [Flavobacterium nitrogenifigens]|uniref:Ribosomal protein L7/L12 C-terminal domain-containing protein n=2 Tax=Flavobacterium TaxID=237 RepID=A0A7W7IWN7_9FLAO|nr:MULTISPECIES: ribosomal protein L7/L12 [Flavobacterium]MBB4801936.1 hypothetical protein [Flavobacterium nitrogenifigens]MBB6386894.1 hypothetical protein [Flavobacterium notoginsengisoli]